MRREPVPGPMRRWQPARWVLEDVIPHEPRYGTDARLLERDGELQRWLFPDHRVELYADDAEGYYLNRTSPSPCWFVMWRLEEPRPDVTDAGSVFPAAVPRGVPVAVSLSYHDAGRWLDAQETVEQVPAAPAVVRWLHEFIEAHYRPEPRQRRRPSSFRSPAERGATAPPARDSGSPGGDHERR